jgi:hypothetical protein
MFEHFKKYLADKHTQKMIMLIGGFIVFLMVLNYFDLLETFENMASTTVPPAVPPAVPPDVSTPETKNNTVETNIETTSMKLKSV